ncbi:MAG TPA: glutamate--tRNA ligase [Bacteroidota bacterium]|nr:glutamate--tRNA ligase [Bacteroidota bacterium]
MNQSNTVRVRFAPSPTGFLHVGGLRTALYNYLFARKNNGVFILRIEDTDRSRYVEGAVENLIETLHWVGLVYDEGPKKGGAKGPYVQSERLDLYKQHAEMLLQSGKAYRCFCTSERLDEMRKQQEKAKISPKYDRTCLKLTPAQIEQNLKNGLPAVIRMKVPDGAKVSFNDIIRGNVEFESDRLDDQVIMKSDGYPTYHLANVVDDHLMEISHVIRGEEWLSSTPKHVLLYQFFGWDLPQFAHLPLLLNPDRSKLSKRQGDVAVEDYRKKGYLPDALVNFVALLGWNPGTEQELFSLEELVTQFSLDRVNKSGAVFDHKKLDWMNFEHLRKKTDAEVLSILKKLLVEKYGKNNFNDDYLSKVIVAMRERVSFINEYVDNGFYFFQPPTEYDPEVVKKRWKPESAAELTALADSFKQLPDSTKEGFEQALHRVAESLKIENAKLIHPLRLAVSGVGGGPGVFDIVSIIGKDETIRRIQNAIETIKG